MCSSLLHLQSLFNAQTGSGGLQYQAITKSEAGLLGSLDSDEAMVFAQIRESGNEGIWTKMLKSRTNLHQTVMNRCLKSLEGKQLVSTVKSVKNPTRKIYMLAGLTPSLELSGGPWYTDNEMDTVFINQLCKFLHQLVCSKTWPESGSEGTSAPIYPASHTPSLPTAAACQAWLKKNNITSTPLKVEDVQSLLDVLVYDGKIEKIPCFAASALSDRKHDRDWNSKGKRKGYDSQSESGSDSGSESGSESESQSESNQSQSGSDRDSDKSSRASSRKRKHSSRSRSKSKKSKHRKSSSSRRRHGSSKSSSRKRRRSREDDRGKNSSSNKSILLTDEEEDDDDEEDQMQIGTGSQIFVYRAVRPFFVKTGWIEIPCGHCPVFNFCEPGGPVNAEGCVYMRDWIQNCKASDVDGNRNGTRRDHHQQIADIEDTTPKTTLNGTTALVEEEEDYDEYEKHSANIGDHLPMLGAEEQDYDDYGGEEV